MIHRPRQNPTRYQRETGEKLPRWRQKLAQYEAEGGYYVHFSDYPKTGVYPTNKYKTPTGFYAYPLSFEGGTISSFATDRPYAIVFKPVRARLLALRNYTPADYARDLKVLHAALGRFQVTDWKRKARVQTPAGQMWNITRMLAKGSVARWTQILYGVLGYDGVIDDCMAIIHTSEACQAVFFDMRTGSASAPQNEKVRIADVLEKGRSIELRQQKGVDFAYKDLTRINLRRVDLRGANLTESDLHGVDLSGMDLTGARLFRTNLYRTNLIDANLDGADLSGAVLSDATLTGASLSGAVLSNATLIRAGLTGVRLNGANLAGANLAGVDLTDAVLFDADLTGADLGSADLTGANLTRANLTGASFRFAFLLRADLAGANLTGADLYRADISMVIWDADTIWPAGFKPPATSYRPAS